MDTPFVYGSYDQKGLDSEYDARGKVPDVDRFKKAQAEGSDCARKRFDCDADVAFGPGPTERIDIYRARSRGLRPVHLFLHGGYWRANHKEEFGFVALPFVPAGATVLVVEYGLIPSIDMAELVRQCRAAVAWAWRNARSFGGDPDNITLSGHSAGGHLTAMMMATDWPAFEAGLPADPVKAGCGISGLYDLEPVRLSSQNDPLGLTAEEAARFSPVTMIPRSGRRLLLPVGALEGREFIRQSQDLAVTWRRHGVDAQAWVMDGHHHFSGINEFLDPGSKLSRAVRELMGIRA